jgi:hypothetical protein
MIVERNPAWVRVKDSLSIKRGRSGERKLE